MHSMTAELGDNQTELVSITLHVAKCHIYIHRWFVMLSSYAYSDAYISMLEWAEPRSNRASKTFHDKPIQCLMMIRPNLSAIRFK